MKKLIRFSLRHISRPWLIRLSKVFVFFVRPFYAGKKVSCPICGRWFRKFLPYGNNGGENRLCPKCLSLERHRLMFLYLRGFTDFFTGKRYRVLHIAPEQPFIKKFRQMKNLRYTTADLVSPLADMHFDVMKIPIKSNSYDWVFCNHVLEHVDNDLTAMREIFRILVPKGRAIMQVPINRSLSTTYEDKSIVDPKERERAFGQYDHQRQHGRDYPDRLRRAGFKVEEFDIKKHVTPSDIDKMRLDRNEILYIATKPARKRR